MELEGKVLNSHQNSPAEAKRALVQPVCLGDKHPLKQNGVTWSFIWVSMAKHFIGKVVTILVVGPRRITFVRYATIVETLGAETHSCLFEKGLLSAQLPKVWAGNTKGSEDNTSRNFLSL